MAKAPDVRNRLLEAAHKLVRAKGYGATTVDDLCAEAKVTKGAFFHYFDSKEALGVAAAAHWTAMTNGFFETAPYRKHLDPLKRVLGYLEFRKAILKGELPEYTCFAGTLLQETYESNPKLKDAAA